ncbi:MAG: helix-turn-helix domain-containing protein [Acidobacteria bacterium]|nr:helix-turn-helix domain-containing protein [Acidobacteriota bacterium]MCA1620676.1 helix-turn-helix domain-containing protein [Acidobacteriota bacterium]
MHNPKPIKKAMVDKDIESAEQLAERAGVSRPTATKILRGEDVLPSKLDAVLNLLGLTRADVYEQAPETVGAS